MVCCRETLLESTLVLKLVLHYNSVILVLQFDCTSTVLLLYVLSDLMINRALTTTIPSVALQAAVSTVQFTRNSEIRHQLLDSVRATM